MISVHLQGRAGGGRSLRMRSWLCLLGVFALPLAARAEDGAKLTVWIGTQGGGSGMSQGIYRAEFDPSDGTLGEVVLAAEYSSPGFLARHPELPVLYAVGNPRDPYEDRSSAVAAFAIRENGTALEFIGEHSTGGRGACHLAVDATGRSIAIANYSDGHISTVRLHDDGSPSTLASVIANRGSGPDPDRQEGPHAHGVYFDESNSFLYVPDLGLDRVLVYRFDAASSRIEPHDPPALATAPGAGPRHLALSPDEAHAYVINELDQTVLVARHSRGEGKFEEIQTIGTLPDDFEEFNKTSEIEVHPGGGFVYASNRGHDSIVVYARDAESGELSLVQHAEIGGRTPRHFKISPCGRWLLSAHQDSNTIRVLPLDPATGRLGEPGPEIACPNPICLLFEP